MLPLFGTILPFCVDQVILSVIPPTFKSAVGKLVKLLLVIIAVSPTAAASDVSESTVPSKVLPALFSANINPYNVVEAATVTTALVVTPTVNPVKLVTVYPEAVPPPLIVLAAVVKAETEPLVKEVTTYMEVAGSPPFVLPCALNVTCKLPPATDGLINVGACIEEIAV